MTRFIKAATTLPILFTSIVLGSFGTLVAQQAAPEKDYISFTLENGLEVVIIENHLVPIATIDLAVRNGSFTEGPEYAGLSHLYEHMFFKANSEFPNSQRFLSHLHKIGAVWNATTREEVVNYYFTLPSSNLEEGLRVMANTIQTPLFDTLELEREREVVLGEFDRHEASPFFRFNRVMDSLLWGDNFTRKEPIGQRPVIKTATVEKMKEIQRRYYIPNNSLLVVAGDVDSASVRAWVEDYFSDWQRGPDPFASDPPPFPDPLDKSLYVEVPAPVDVVQMRYSWHGPSVVLDPEATYAADVLIFILSQNQSRFQRRLVESGLAQGAGFGYYTQHYTGPISVSIATAPEKARQALQVLREELAAMDDPGYFSDEELATAKSILRVDHLYDAEETVEWAHTVGFWWSTTGGLEYFRSYLDNLSEVTREDIQRFIRQYMHDQPFLFGVSSNPEVLRALALQPTEVLE